MKRDKLLVVFIVIISCVITGVLQYSRSPLTLDIISYLTALDRNLCAFCEGDTNEVYGFTSPLKSGIENDIISVSVENFVEEHLIIEEFTNKEQVGPILCRDEPINYISYCLSLTNNINMNINDNTPGLRMKEVQSNDTIFSGVLQGIKMATSNHCATHRIMAGDNLYNLAKRYYNNEAKWIKIYQANKNRIPDPHSLKIGQELLIPDASVSI